MSTLAEEDHRCSRRPIRMSSSINNSTEEEQQQQRRKKPSYVGLSCTVSGYSSYIRYSSPDGRRLTSPPEQIPVSSPPQTLDSIALVRNANMRQNGINKSDDVTDRASAAVTPEASSQPVPNLVQKQIERLYGSKVKSISSSSSSRSGRSPDSETTTTTTTTTTSSSSSGGFFSMRFGITKQRDRHTANDSRLVMEEQELSSEKNNNNNCGDNHRQSKVPAVWKLLRPEFREQLKNNSCQIPNDQTSPSAKKTTTNNNNNYNGYGGGKERFIPIAREVVVVENGGEKSKKSNERIIPIVKEEKKEVVIPIQRETPPPKPALPVKPLSPPPSNKVETHSVRSPGLVQQAEQIVHQDKKVVEEEEDRRSDNNGEGGFGVSDLANGLEVIGEVADDDVDEMEAKELVEKYEGAGGVHEIGLLSTIMEEDNESNASGSLLNLSLMKSSNGVAAEVPPPLDGHYFIKLLENEIFKLEELICEFEEDMNNTSIAEDVRENILAAVGKAKLLMAQKLAQFRGLCDKNITLNVVDDPFVPTGQDLAGFWDMVYLQVVHIHALFAELVVLRSNDWKKEEEPANGISPAENGVRKTKPRRTSAGGGPRTTPTSTPSPSTSSSSKKSSPSPSAEARNEARRKMLEEKKRLMKEKMMQQQQQNGNSSNSEGLFVQI